MESGSAEAPLPAGDGRRHGPVIERKLAEEGITTPFSGAELGSLVSAMGSGLILQYYLEPDAVDPELLPRALRRLLGIPQHERDGSA